MAQKKSKERRRALGDNVLSDQFQTVAAILASDWCQKLVFFWHQSEARMAATVWNWSGKTLSPGALLAVLYFSFVPYISACLDFPSPPLSAPGSPRMGLRLYVSINPGEDEVSSPFYEYLFQKGRVVKLLEFVGDVYVWSFYRKLLCPVYLLAVGFT